MASDTQAATAPSKAGGAAATGTIAGAGGGLFYRWSPVADARAVAVVVHGLAEHSGRYVHVMEALAAAGVASLAVDLRGHGRSDGTRVFVERFEDYADDAHRAVGKARELAPGLPIYAIGHSMGGLVTILLALDHGAELAGVVLSSPGVRGAVHVPAWKDGLGKIMSKLWPKLAIPTGIPPEWVSRDPEVVRAYASDPLVTKKATARWYTEFLRAQERAFAEAKALTMPALVLVAGKDKLVDAAAERRFVEALGAVDKTLVPYPDLFHEVFNEPEKAAVLADVTRWLAERTR